MKKLLALTLAALLLAAVLTGCASAPAEPPAADSQPTQTEQPAAEEPAAEQPAAEEEPVAEEPALADGVYTADFDTDSSMFHANEACDGKGTLTVKDGEMTIHVSLVSKTILNLFPGLAEDAQKDGAVLLQPTTDTVTYSDGLSDEVYGFDIPVEALDEDFQLRLRGTYPLELARQPMLSCTQRLLQLFLKQHSDNQVWEIDSRMLDILKV